MIHARSRCRSQGLTGQFNTGRFAGWLPDPTPQPAPADGPANDATSSWIRMTSGGAISAMLPASPREIRAAGFIAEVFLGDMGPSLTMGTEDNQWTAWLPLPWVDVLSAITHVVVLSKVRGGIMRVEFR